MLPYLNDKIFLKFNQNHCKKMSKFSKILAKTKMNCERRMLATTTKTMKFTNFSDPQEIIKFGQILKEQTKFHSLNVAPKLDGTKSAVEGHFGELEMKGFGIDELKQNDENGKEEALQFLLEQFMFDEALSRNLEFNKEEAKPFYRDIINACCHQPFSLLIRDKNANNKLVGVYLNQILCRDAQIPEIYGPNNKKYSENVQEMCNILHICESSIWTLLPENVKCIANNVFLSIHRDYHHLGIGLKIVELMNAKLKAEGNVQAIISELTASGTQKISRKLGYFPLLIIPFDGWRNEQGQPKIEGTKVGGAHSLQLVCKPYWF